MFYKIFLLVLVIVGIYSTVGNIRCYIETKKFLHIFVLIVMWVAIFNYYLICC